MAYDCLVIYVIYKTQSYTYILISVVIIVYLSQQNISIRHLKDILVTSYSLRLFA